MSFIERIKEKAKKTILRSNVSEEEIVEKSEEQEEVSVTTEEIPQTSIEIPKHKKKYVLVRYTTPEPEPEFVPVAPIKKPTPVPEEETVESLTKRMYDLESLVRMLNMQLSGFNAPEIQAQLQGSLDNVQLELSLLKTKITNLLHQPVHSDYDKKSALFQLRQVQIGKLNSRKEKNERNAKTYEMEISLFEDNFNHEFLQKSKKKLAQALHFGKGTTSKKEYKNEFDVLASDISKYHVLISTAEQEGKSKRQEYFSKRLCEIVRNNSKLLSENVFALDSNPEFHANVYLALQGRMFNKEELTLEEIKTFCMNLVEFAKSTIGESAPSVS